MVGHRVESDPAATGRRIEPSIPVAVVAVLAYMAVVNTIQATSGIPYTEWFSTAENVVRTIVTPLAVGNVLLLAFVVWARWDIFWRDPERLPRSRLGAVILALFVLVIVLRLVTLRWTEVPVDLLLVLLLSGVLVGLAEELVFRGIVLRCLRTGGRPEWSAALWTAVGFGLFHLPNIFLGTGLWGLSQVVLAATTGYALYVFRRWWGLLWVAMVAHGTYDISSFLSGSYSTDLGTNLDLTLAPVLALLCVVALVRSRRADREFTVTPQGLASAGT